MNCHKCGASDIEKQVLIDKGKLVEALSNFCALCGYDLRPHHKEMMILYPTLKPFIDEEYWD